MTAYAECGCGKTKCPQENINAAKLRDAATAWLVKLRFARIEHGALICPICKTVMRVRVGARSG